MHSASTDEISSTTFGIRCGNIAGCVVPYIWSKVDEKDGAEKFASSHDIRRAFGTRWARIVPSGILQQLMRHSSVETTLKYYVNISPKDTIAELRHDLKKSVQSDTSESETNKTEFR